MSKPTLNVVIARYNESLDWIDLFTKFINEFKVKIYVYNKGGNLVVHDMDGVDSTIEALPNVGRESHTYLYHMIEHYGAEASDNDITIFLQGHIDDHIRWTIKKPKSDANNLRQEYIETLINDAKINSISSSNAVAHSVGVHSATRSFRLHEYKGPIQLAQSPFDVWFEETFGIPFPSSVKWWVGAMFAVRTSLITKRPISCYQRVINDLMTINPELCHYLERSWLYFFV